MTTTNIIQQTISGNDWEMSGKDGVYKLTSTKSYTFDTAIIDYTVALIYFKIETNGDLQPIAGVGAGIEDAEKASSTQISYTAELYFHSQTTNPSVNISTLKAVIIAECE